ncbi:MAG: hypothetical protein SF029_19900 [bacterium]|nr:hypothetical protein [bacterium]
MNFLKNLFGGGGKPQNTSEGGRAIYLYVRPKRCDQIVRVRIDLWNDLSENDEGGGYFVRKTAQGTRCPFAAEIHVSFDGKRNITQQGVENGAFVEEAEYEAWLAAQEQGMA